VVALTDVTLAIWALFELDLRVREARHGKGGRAHDRGTWLSLAAALLLLPALVRRIRVEEAELDRVLGDAYRGYQTTTARLLPGVW
jgi:hypothetical protein